jgi:hypothetical protein
MAEYRDEQPSTHRACQKVCETLPSAVEFARRFTLSIPEAKIILAKACTLQEAVGIVKRKRG